MSKARLKPWRFRVGPLWYDLSFSVCVVYGYGYESNDSHPWRARFWQVLMEWMRLGRLIQRWKLLWSGKLRFIRHIHSHVSLIKTVCCCNFTDETSSTRSTKGDEKSVDQGNQVQRLGIEGKAWMTKRLLNPNCIDVFFSQHFFNSVLTSQTSQRQQIFFLL